MKLIREYFNKDEILTPHTSNLYSIFLQFRIWHIPNLKPHSINFYFMYQQMPLNSPREHQLFQYKLYNKHLPQADWIESSFNQIFNPHQKRFRIIKSKKYHVRNNLLSIRITILNNKIDLDELNFSLDVFKVKHKNKCSCRKYPLLGLI